MNWSIKRGRCIIYLATILASIVIVNQFMKLMYADLKEHSIEVGIEGFPSVTVTYNEFIPQKWRQTVVLLHEQSMVSTWESLSTTEILKHAGYRAISLTLPVFNLKSSQNMFVVKAAILVKTLKILRAEDGILVTPTSTASYGLAVVLRSGLPLRGFIVISPVDTDLFTPKEYKLLKVPSMVVYCKDDRHFQEVSLKYMKLIPNVELIPMPEAGPSCHTGQPEKCNFYLLAFLARIK